MIGIVVSRADDASMNIGDRLREIVDWSAATDETRPDATGGGDYYEHRGFELRTFEDLHLHLDRPAEAFSDPDVVVVASRHAGETGPLLTAHFTGNFGPAEAGGAANELARACPNALSSVIQSLDKFAPSGYDVGLECTHHGPTTVGAPSMFVEIGSDAPQWNDKSAAEAVARAILDLQGVSADRDRTVVGFGGSHYAPRFERVVRETDWTVGHIWPDWSLEDPSGDLIEQAFGKSTTTQALLDRDDTDLAETISSMGYRIVSETWLRETTGVSLDLVSTLESKIEPVDAGLRFGSLAKEWVAEMDYQVVRPDPDLLADIVGIDRDRTRSMVIEHTIAFETTEAGSRVDGRLVVPNQNAYDELIDAFCDLLAEAYETVETGAETIAVTERRFDPERAVDLGVPEGPAFGRLADGQSVEVEGRTVTPAAVHDHDRIVYSKRA